MRINIQKLIAADRATLKYAGIVLLSAALSAWMLVDLSRRNARIGTLTAEVEANQRQTAGAPVLTEDQVRRMAEEERLFERSLVGEESVPLVFDQITRVGSDHRVQMEIQSEEITIPETPGDPLEASARALGLSRYLVVTVKFRAGYSDAAQFLGAISRLPLTLSVRSLEMHRDPPLLGGTLRLHVYKKGARG